MRSSSAILALIVSHGATAAAPVPSGGGDSGSLPVSPAVVATWFASHAGDAPSELQLLILWRGAPGWFAKPEAEGSRQTGSASASAGGPERATARLEMAGIVLEAELDVARRHARVGPHEIDLGEANVVLMDGVDAVVTSASVDAVEGNAGVDEKPGFRVAGLVRIDPAFPSPPDLAPLLRRSEEIVTFLRCDATLEDPSVDAMLHATCARLGGEPGH